MSENIIKKLTAHNHIALFAGGCVRDMIMGIESDDIDIATSATPDEVEAIFEKTIPVGKEFGVIIVVEDGVEYEVATFRKNSPFSNGRQSDSVEFSDMQHDAKCRDLTINGMFYDPLSNTTYDPVSGRADIENELIRFVDDPVKRIQEDKLRMLRAIRFAIKFNFSIDPYSLTAIQNNACTIGMISKERVRDELVKMIKLGRPRLMIELLELSGLLKCILPLFAHLKGETQNPKWHPEVDVMEHTILVMENLVDESIEVQLAGMFHDIAKPICRTENESGIHHYGHDKLGEDMTKVILEDLKFDSTTVRTVSRLVGLHMRLSNFTEMKMSKQKRFVAGEFFESLLQIRIADIKGSHGDLDLIVDVINIIKSWGGKKHDDEIIKPDPFVTGKNLIDLGFKPGPAMGIIIEEMYDMQLEGCSKKEIFKVLAGRYQDE